MKEVALDNLCRLVLPVNYRKTLKIKKGDKLTMTMENGAIVIRPQDMTCRLCDAPIEEAEKIPLCANCILKVKQI